MAPPKLESLKLLNQNPTVDYMVPGQIMKISLASSTQVQKPTQVAQLIPGALSHGQ